MTVMNEQPKSKWYWRLLRRALICLAILATLAAALISEEDWRGKHDWNTYKHAAEAKGERFDMLAFVPTNMPDDENFYAAPIIAAALKPGSGGNPEAVPPSDTNQVHRMDFNIYRINAADSPTNGGNWQRGTLTDLSEWTSYFQSVNETPAGRTNGFPVATQPQTPAAAILLALGRFNPALEELRQAGLRPYAWMPLDYERGFDVVSEVLPWLATEKRCAQFLQLRILAELDAGQSDAALADVKLNFRLTDALRSQPFLISHLVRLAMTAIALQPIYEGLAQHRWNDAQLAELENTLATQDYLADFQRSMRGERNCAIEAFETQRLTRELKS